MKYTIDLISGADIIDASRAALVDSIEYKLIGDMERQHGDFLACGSCPRQEPPALTACIL